MLCRLVTHLLGGARGSGLAITHSADDPQRGTSVWSCFAASTLRFLVRCFSAVVEGGAVALRAKVATRQLLRRHRDDILR